jgi:hypothetical protein
VVAVTGYKFTVSRSGRYIRGQCRGHMQTFDSGLITYAYTDMGNEHLA